MPVKIPPNAIKQYLGYLEDPKKFRIPSRYSREYNVAEHFFGNIYHAQQSLISLLENIRPFPTPTSPLDGEVYSEFVLTSHADLRQAHGMPLPDFGEEVTKLLVGQSPLMLEPKGKKGVKAAILQRRYADPNAIVITSVLPRAMHHALLKYRPRLKDELEDFADEIDRQMGENHGRIRRETYLDLIALTLNHGIIPTLLLNSHYHGARDLLPEKADQFNTAKFMRTDICRSLYSGYDNKKVEAILNRFRKLAKTGQDPFQYVEGEGGEVLTENLLLYVDRVSHFLRLFFPNGRFHEDVRSRRVNLVGHSSNIDAISTFFRYYGMNQLTIEKAPKYLTRGREIVVYIGPKGEYLNDPLLLKPLREEAMRQVSHLRGLSVDALIRRGEGVLETPLISFREVRTANSRESTYKVYPERLESILSSNDPIIIFGHGGQGKSILVSEIARRFLKGEFGEAYRNYIPIMFNCNDLTEMASVNNMSSGNPNLEGVLRSPIISLPTSLLKEYRFAFIIDDYQKLGRDYTREFEGQIHRLRREGNVVILLSRLERDDVHPPQNSGYKTVQIDTETVAKQTDDFIRDRVNPDDMKEFKSYSGQYDASVNGFYLMKLFLTMIYPGNHEKKGLLDYVIDPDTARLIKEGGKLTAAQLYDAQTDYIIGCDIRRSDGRLGKDEVRALIAEQKNCLAKKAFNDVFGAQ